MTTTPQQKQKAKAAAKQMLKTWQRNNRKQLYELTTLSWQSRFKPEDLNRFMEQIPINFKIKHINYKVEVMFHLIVSLYFENKKLNGKYRIVFQSQSSTYVTSPKTEFTFNPISLKKIN